MNACLIPPKLNEIKRMSGSWPLNMNESLAPSLQPPLPPLMLKQKINTHQLCAAQREPESMKREWQRDKGCRESRSKVQLDAPQWQWDSTQPGHWLACRTVQACFDHIWGFDSWDGLSSPGHLGTRWTQDHLSVLLAAKWIPALLQCFPTYKVGMTSCKKMLCYLVYSMT